MADEHTPLQSFVLDSWSRVGETVHDTLEGIDEATLVERITPGANTIAWLVWHLTRVADDHMAQLADAAQVWIDGAWATRFGLALAETDTGYGHSTDQVAAVAASADLLLGYHDAVATTTQLHLGALRDDDLQRIVDESYNPPVTAGVRIASVINDCTQHAGQAALLRGLLDSVWTTADG